MLTMVVFLAEVTYWYGWKISRDLVGSFREAVQERSYVEPDSILDPK